MMVSRNFSKNCPIGKWSMISNLKDFAVFKIWVKNSSANCCEDKFRIPEKETKGGFPIEIEYQISLLISYSLAIFIL